MAFSENTKKLIIEILTEWANKEVSEAKARAAAAGLSSSNFIKSVKNKISLEAGINARGIVQFMYYGNILDRDFIKYGKGISTEQIKKWLEAGGMAKMGGYKGQSKNPQRQINDMAWGIRKSWEKQGGRKGRKWDGVGKLSKSTEKINDDLYNALQSEIYDSVLESLKNQ